MLPWGGPLLKPRPNAVFLRPYEMNEEASALNGHTFEILEFDKIKEHLREYAVSRLGQRLIEELQPATNPETVAQRLAETTETRAILEAAGHIPLHGLSDVTEDLERAARGGVLSPAALLALADFLRGSRRLKRFMARYRELAPQVSGYALAITDCRDLEDRIERSIDGARVSSAASPRLAKIRAQIETIKARIEDRLKSFLISPNYRELLQEAIVSLKDGRYCLAIKASRRHQVAGSVVASSGSGQTVFVEPAAVRELTNELRILEHQEEAEEYQVLAGLSGEVAARIQVLRLNLETMAVYDFACAKAKYSRAIRGIPAAIAPAQRIVIRGGRHPLLGRDAVPLDLHLGGGLRTLLITGPNTGGKTVALKTIGIIVLMTQAGLHVPAEPGTATGVFDQVLADIGDRQSIEQSLSTFSGHMRNIVGILEAAGRRSLVLLDEIGTGTDPAEGAALAAAVLDDLCLAGALTVATTHYGDLKRFADGRPDFANGCMEFDPETLLPLFRLRMGEAGRSNGIWIAERLGMRPETLAKARAFLRREEPGPNREEGRDMHATHPGRAPAGNTAEDEPIQCPMAVDCVPESSPAAGISPTGNGASTVPSASPRHFQPGDKVYVGPLRESGLFCGPANTQGHAMVLVRGKRIKVAEKRLKLQIPREQLYPDPESYDLDIVLLSKEDRRLKRRMAKRHVEGKARVIEDPREQ